LSPPLCADPQRKLDPFKIELVGGFFPTRGVFLGFLVVCQPYLKNMRKSRKRSFFPSFRDENLRNLFETTTQKRKLKKKLDVKKITLWVNLRNSTFPKKKLQRLG